MEAGFLLILLVATAALHYTHSFYSPFPELTGAPIRHDPIYNYVLVLGTVFGGYLGSRVLCAIIFSAIPHSVKTNRMVQCIALAVAAPAVIFALYIAAGSPALEQHVLVKWFARNWQRNGRKDVEWCLRLLVLLVCWQGLLGLAAAICRTAWYVLDLSINVIAGVGLEGTSQAADIEDITLPTGESEKAMGDTAMNGRTKNGMGSKAKDQTVGSGDDETRSRVQNWTGVNDLNRVTY